MKEFEDKIIIRQANIADFPALMVLILRYLQENENFKPDEKPEKADNVRVEIWNGLLNNLIMVFVAEKATKRNKKQLIGYGIFDLRNDIFGDIIAWGHHLFVEKEYRDKGVAERLLKSGEEFAKQHNAKAFYIDTARPDWFKRKLGYSPLYQVLIKQFDRLEKEVNKDVE